jgi:hypothetical protein
LLRKRTTQTEQDSKLNVLDSTRKLMTSPLKSKLRTRKSTKKKKNLFKKSPPKRTPLSKRELRIPSLLRRKPIRRTTKLENPNLKKNWIWLKRRNNSSNNNKNSLESNKRLLTRLISPSRNNKDQSTS